MLALERQDALVLVGRNIHHSIMNGLKAFGLDFRFLPTPYEPRFEALLPPSVDEILEGLRRYPEAIAVIYTSPTYEGLAANTRMISQAVHEASEHALVIVDEAWGGHLRFHPDLPLSAIEAGADVAVQSTHKLAGGLQQTGLMHWREGRVDSELMEEAYREYVTTSPSYHLLASADAAVRMLVAQGEQELGRAIARTRELKAALRERLPDLDFLDDPAWLEEFAEHAAGMDLVKTTLGLARYELSGYDVAQELVERGIVIEKAGVNTITLITTFQLARRRRGADRRRARPPCSSGRVRAGRRAPRSARQPVPRDRRPAGDASLRRAPLLEVDRPRGAAARGRRLGRRGVDRGLPAGRPAGARGLQGQRRTPSTTCSRRATRAARSSRATRACGRCASSEPAIRAPRVASSEWRATRRFPTPCGARTARAACACASSRAARSR